MKTRLFPIPDPNIYEKLEVNSKGRFGNILTESLCVRCLGVFW